jgi:hypothetical protein
MMKKTLAAVSFGVLLGLSMPAAAQTTGSVSKSSQTQPAETYKSEEIMAQGRQFFGKASRDLAGAVEYAFKNQGEPTAYMVLVYNSRSPDDMYQRFGGVEGSAYFIGGLGVNFQQNDDIVLAPIRTGLGARLGANIGYLKYSPQPTWNPF